MQRGIVLVLAVLIIAATMAVAFAFSNVVILYIQQARLIDQSTQARYLAESGAERALYQMRIKEAVPAEDCGSVVPGSACQEQSGFCSLTSNEVACITQGAGGAQIHSGWDISVTKQNTLSSFLAGGDVLQLDLFNPYRGGSFGSGIQSFRVTSNNPVSATLYGEITNLTWLLGGTPQCTQPQTVPEQPVISRGQIYLNVVNSVAQSGFVSGFADQPSLDPNCAYVVRISNIIDPISESTFSINFFDTAQNVDPVTDRVDIPGRLVVDSYARFGLTEQRVQVSAPIRPPVSGLYDFVIFSEEKIEKVDL